MATRTIVTSQPDVACDVCERRLLRGEQPDVFVGAGRRRIVCELCAPRAAHEGWLRETDNQPLTLPPMRSRRGRSLFERLRQVGRPPADAPQAPVEGSPDELQPSPTTCSPRPRLWARNGARDAEPLQALDAEPAQELDAEPSAAPPDRQFVGDAEEAVPARDPERRAAPPQTRSRPSSPPGEPSVGERPAAAPAGGASAYLREAIDGVQRQRVPPPRRRRRALARSRLP